MGVCGGGSKQHGMALYTEQRYNRATMIVSRPFSVGVDTRVSRHGAVLCKTATRGGSVGRGGSAIVATIFQLFLY